MPAPISSELKWAARQWLKTSPVMETIESRERDPLLAAIVYGPPTLAAVNVPSGATLPPPLADQSTAGCEETRASNWSNTVAVKRRLSPFPMITLDGETVRLVGDCATSTSTLLVASSPSASRIVTVKV